MAHGRAAGEHRPRTDTFHWAAAATTGCAVLAAATRDAGYFFAAGMAFALMLQCAQRIVVEGRHVRRTGLRAVTLDLATAELVHPGCAWWRELFLCGASLQLRDADGNRLYLESWLWAPETRALLVEAVARRAPS
jgi:hypothetical protein